MKLLYIMFFFILKCNSVAIKTAYKQVVIPGIASGVTIIRYSTQFEVKRKLKIQSIQIQDDSINLNYGLFNIDTGKILKPHAVLEKGNYSVEIIAPYSMELENSIDILQLTFLSGKKEYQILKKVTLKSALYMR